MLYDYVPLALTCYDLFTVSWMKVNGTHIFLGGQKAPFAISFYKILWENC